MREHLPSYVLGTVLLAATLWMTFAIPRYVAEAIDIMAVTGAVDEGAFFERVLLIVGFALAGDMSLRADFNDSRSFLFSIGGFHPAFDAPTGFDPLPGLHRVTVRRRPDGRAHSAMRIGPPSPSASPLPDMRSPT